MARGLIETLKEALENMGVPPHIVIAIFGTDDDPKITRIKIVTRILYRMFKKFGEAFVKTKFSFTELLNVMREIVGEYPETPSESEDDECQAYSTEIDRGPTGRAEEVVLTPSLKKWVPMADHSGGQSEKGRPAQDKNSVFQPFHQTKIQEEENTENSGHFTSPRACHTSYSRAKRYRGCRSSSTCRG